MLIWPWDWGGVNENPLQLKLERQIFEYSASYYASEIASVKFLEEKEC